MMTSLLDRLSVILSSDLTGSNVEATSLSCAKLDSLLQWNEDMDAAFLVHRENQAGEVTKLLETNHERSTGDCLWTKVSEELHFTLLAVLDGKSLVVPKQPNHLLTADLVLRNWNEQSGHPPLCLMDLVEVLRASQNCLRWYLQILIPQPGHVNEEAFIGRWQTDSMLEIYLLAVEDLQLNYDCLHGSRYASNLLFYTTFCMATATDQTRQRTSYTKFMTESSLLNRLLRLLLRQREFMAALSLSLVRNVHNAVLATPSTNSTEAVDKVTCDITVEDASKFAAWVVTTGARTISYKEALRDLTLYVVRHSSTSLDPFPGSSPDDRRAELVVEILRCCYALRVGKELNNDIWKQVIIGVLLNLNARHDQCYQCQLAVVALLSDADSDVLCDISSAFGPKFVQILDIQVSSVMNEERVDNRAAAALTPILIVLYKCCNSHQMTQSTVRDIIFPTSEAFEVQMAAEESRTGHKRAVNMSPLDAPVGELRWKLIQLLTSPQSTVKRLAGELLFVLCRSEPRDFIRRVGMGNAIPLLSSKGLVHLGS